MPSVTKEVLPPSFASRICMGWAGLSYHSFLDGMNVGKQSVCNMLQ